MNKLFVSLFLFLFQLLSCVNTLVLNFLEINEFSGGVLFIDCLFSTFIINSSLEVAIKMFTIHLDAIYWLKETPGMC